MAASWRKPSTLLRCVRPTKSFLPMRRTSPPSRVPGRDTYSSFRRRRCPSHREKTLCRPHAAQDIAAFEGSGKRYVFELSKPRERLSERLSLATASFGTERQNHRQYIENDGGVFNKHGVGKRGLRGKRNNASA